MLKICTNFAAGVVSTRFSLFVNMYRPADCVSSFEVEMKFCGLLTSAPVVVHSGSLNSRSAAVFVLNHAAVGSVESCFSDARQKELCERWLFILRC